MELEKILTISARDYCEMNGTKLRDYAAKGIHARLTLGQYYTHESPAAQILKYIPEGTEAIVCYAVCKLVERSYGELCVVEASGTALIPKKTKGDK